MALIVAFKLDMTTHSASLQSRNTDESYFFQKSRSPASLAISGNGEFPTPRRG